MQIWKEYQNATVSRVNQGLSRKQMMPSNWLICREFNIGKIHKAMVSIQDAHEDGELTLKLRTAVIIHTSRNGKTSRGYSYLEEKTSWLDCDLCSRDPTSFLWAPRKGHPNFMLLPSTHRFCQWPTLLVPTKILRRRRKHEWA